MWRRNCGHSMVHATSGSALAELLFVDSVTADSQAGHARAGSLAALGQALAHAQPSWKIRCVASVDMAIEQMVRRPAQVVLAQLDDVAVS